MGTQFFCLLFGIIMLAVGAKYFFDSRRMHGFRSVPGNVIARDIVRMQTARGTNNSRPSVRYRYVVEGVTLESDRMSYAYRGRSHERALDDLAKIPDVVTVWYDPKNPADGILYKHGPAMGCVIAFVGGVVMLVGLINILSG